MEGKEVKKIVLLQEEFPYRIQRSKQEIRNPYDRFIPSVSSCVGPDHVEPLLRSRFSRFYQFSLSTFIKQIGAIKLIKLIYVFSSIVVAYVANFLRERDKKENLSKRNIFENIMSSMNFNICKEIYYE